jgi:predicted rRNA methylase YqxC with S4 and FtsJ domains
VYRDGNTGYGTQNKIREQHTDTHESTDSQAQNVQEVDLALAGVGIGNIDVADDGTTTEWEPEDTDTKTDTETSTDSSEQRVDQLDVAHYQDGKFGIDVQNILSSQTDLQQDDNSASDDILAQRIDEVQVASADAGRGQTDVSFDPNTEVIGDDPDEFTETDTEENTDDTVYNTQQLDVAYYQQGSFEIDVQNLLGTTLEVETSDNSGFTDSLAQQIDEVQVASVDSGRGQTDVSFDPNTQVIGDDPDSVEENDVHESTDTSAQRIDSIDTVFYQDGTFGIDVHSLVSSSLDIATTDVEELAERVAQQVEEVQVASVDAGRGQVDVSFDPNTIIIGDDPDSFEEVNTEAATDDSIVSPEEVLVASYNYGVHAIHVSDDGNTTVSGSSPSSFTSTEKNGQNDLRQQQIEQVQELYVNEGRVNIDTTDA